jgi:hypothetical protein
VREQEESASGRRNSREVKEVKEAKEVKEIKPHLEPRQRL